MLHGFFEALILTVSTCISGGLSGVAKANKLESLEQNSISIIESFNESYDVSGFNLDYDEQQSMLKQKLLEYNKLNCLLDEQQLDALERTLQLDDSYTYIPNFDDMYLRKESSKLSFDDNRFNIYDPTVSNEFNVIGLSSFSDFIDVFGRVQGPTIGTKVSPRIGDTSSELPMLAYDSNKVNYQINGKLGNVTFVGLTVSPDACIWFYNLVSDWLNKQIIYAASGCKGVASSIISIIKVYAGESYEYVVTKLVKYFAKIWKQLLSVITSSGLAGIIIGEIIVLFCAIVIGTVVFMYWAGSKGLGFAIGWFVYGWLDWRWYCGTIQEAIL